MSEISRSRRTRSGSGKRQRLRLVQVRCTDDEHAAMAAAAERVGLSVGAFLRHQGIGTAGPRAMRRPPVERAMLAQLLGQVGKCGSNVNQIARAINTDREKWPDDLVQAIAELREIGMQAVLGELRGAGTAIMRTLGRAVP